MLSFFDYDWRLWSIGTVMVHNCDLFLVHDCPNLFRASRLTCARPNQRPVSCPSWSQHGSTRSRSANGRRASKHRAASHSICKLGNARGLYIVLPKSLRHNVRGKQCFCIEVDTLPFLPHKNFQEGFLQEASKHVCNEDWDDFPTAYKCFGSQCWR